MATRENNEDGRVATESSTLKVAWVLAGDIRPYRVPFVNALSRREDINLTVYHSAPRKRFGAPERPSRTSANVVQLRDILWPLAGQRTAWLRGTSAILRGGFDVIICQETVHNLTTWAIVSARNVFGYRFVLHGHFYRQTHIAGTRLGVRAMARRLLASRASALLAYTNRGLDALVESGVPSQKVFVTRNTLDTQSLMEIADDVSADVLGQLRRRLGITGQSVLLAVGRLLPEKRIDVLIEALRVMNATQEDVTLIVIGDGVERRRLEELARGMCHVHFLGAIYDERELAPYLLIADLLVIPGRIGLTCVQGFTAALPCMTASARAVHQSPEFDYIHDGVNGIVVSDLSPHAFAQALIGVLGDDERLRSLGRSARRTASSLSMQNMVEEFVKGVHYAAGQPRM